MRRCTPWTADWNKQVSQTCFLSQRRELLCLLQPCMDQANCCIPAVPAGVAESEGNWPALNQCPASLEIHQVDPAQVQLETAVGVNPGGS